MIDVLTLCRWAVDAGHATSATITVGGVDYQRGTLLHVKDATAATTVVDRMVAEGATLPEGRTATGTKFTHDVSRYVSAALDGERVTLCWWERREPPKPVVPEAVEPVEI